MEWTYHVGMGSSQRWAGAGCSQLPEPEFCSFFGVHISASSPVLFHSELTYQSVFWQKTHGTASGMTEGLIRGPCAVIWTELVELTCRVTPTRWPEGPKEGIVPSTRYLGEEPQRGVVPVERQTAPVLDRRRGGSGCEVQRTETMVKIRQTAFPVDTNKNVGIQKSS